MDRVQSSRLVIQSSNIYTLLGLPRFVQPVIYKCTKQLSIGSELCAKSCIQIKGIFYNLAAHGVCYTFAEGRFFWPDFSARSVWIAESTYPCQSVCLKTQHLWELETHDMKIPLYNTIQVPLYNIKQFQILAACPDCNVMKWTAKYSYNISWQWDNYSTYSSCHSNKRPK